MIDKPEGAPNRPLRRGWTTGACATAAAKAAYTALLTGEFPDPVSIRLPGGETPAFALAWEARGCDDCAAGVIKDAGDDPDVTHGALIIASVRRGEAGGGVIFRAGEGVGMVTREGLPIPPGDPAINPVPRRMMMEAVAELAAEFGDAGDVVIEVSVPGGAEIAIKTWNPRLGIVGGLSILGTTGIVVPFSCAAWIHSIHRGIDVARANGIDHVAGSTGSTSEQAVQRIHGLSELALLDMGDFAGGMLKYLRRKPVPRVTIAGGFGKLTKLAQGFLDLHSGRSQVDFPWLAERLAELGARPELVSEARMANTANQVLTRAIAAGIPLADLVAARARAVALGVLGGCGTDVEVLVFDRKGGLEGRAGFAAETRRVLILGGTAEAAALARGLGGVGIITSLAGRTRAPAALPGEVRIGGFGGAEGLAAYLEEQRITALVDATHPFAATISHHAEAACRQRPTARLIIVRPAWEPQPGDRWIEVDDMNAAVEAIPAGARVFLTVGRQELAPFTACPDAWMLARVIDPPDEPLAGISLVTGRGPFDLDAERNLLVEHGITVIVAKNSGGDASYPKLVAARELNIPVIMVRRPALPPGDRVGTVEEALDWLGRR
jgi:cobalt-precorrin-5B (C1)-methyltransferase